MHKVSSIKHNFIMNFILTASGFIFPLITFPYISRVLLAGGNGKIAFVTAYVNYFLMVSQLGIPTYGVRACARVRDNKEKMSHTVQEIMVINFIMTMLVTASYIITVFTVPRLFEDRTLFMINAVTFFLQFIGINWLFQALEEYEYITKRSILFKIISLVLMFALVHKANDYIIYGTITVFAAVGSNVLNISRARRYVSFRKTAPYNLKQHMKPILILFAQSLAISVYTNLDAIMLGFMRSNNEVGYYNAAVRIKVILTSLVTSLGGVLLPRMSYYVKNRMKSDFARIMIKALNFSLFLSIPLALFFSITARDSLLFLAGPDYLPAVMSMVFLILTIIPIGITNVLGIQVLTPLEDENLVMLSVLAGAGADFILNLIFIPHWGASGASCATLIAEIIVLIMQMIFAKNIIRPFISHIKYIKYGCFGVAATIPAYLVTKIHMPGAFIRLLASGIVFAAIYVGLLFLVKDPILMLILRRKK